MGVIFMWTKSSMLNFTFRGKENMHRVNSFGDHYSSYSQTQRSKFTKAER